MPGRRRIDIARVKQLLAKGLTQNQVALRLGVTKSGVSRIAKEQRQEAAK